MIRSAGKSTVVAALGLLVTGCASGGWIREQPLLAERARQSPGSFLQPALKLTAPLESLVGSYTMRLSKGIGRRSVDTFVSVRRPGDLDILVLDPTGGTQAYLRANAVEVGLFLREERVLYRGPATRTSFEQAIGFGLSAPDVVAALLGYAIDPASYPPGQPSWDESARRVRIDYGNTASVWLLPPTLAFDRVVHRRGDDIVELEVLDWVSTVVDGQALSVPSRLQLRIEPDGYGIAMRLIGTGSANFEVPAANFELQVPANVLQLPISDLGRDGGLFRREAPTER